MHPNGTVCPPTRAIARCMLTAAATAIVVTLSACSRQSDSSNALVTVDGVAILPGALPAAAASAPDAQRKQLVEALVAEQLFANAAAANQLDADPVTATTLASARRQVLAQAYRASLASKEAVASPADLKDFFEAHPELFSQRKIYRVQELAIEAPATGLDSVITALQGMKTLGQRSEWLRKNGVRFETRVVLRAAEDWPSDLLPHLFKMQDGAAFDVPSPRGVSILQLTGTELQPLNFEQAKPRIAAFVNNQRLAALFEREQQRLRKSAKLEYGETTRQP